MPKKIPYFSDKTLYRCGAVSSRMALAYFGIKKTEKELVAVLGTSLEQGTDPEKIKTLFEKCELETHFVSNKKSPRKTFKSIQNYLEKDYLVICFVNRLVYDKKTPFIDTKTQWEHENYSSHYIVAYRIEDGRVFFNDPHELVGEAVLDTDTFQDALLEVFIAVKKLK